LGIVGNIKRVSCNKNKNTLEFQNNNDFGISGVKIGFTKNKQCTSSDDDYEVIATCKAQGVGTNEGVNSRSFGMANCGVVPSDAASLRYCVVAFSPTYKNWDSGLLDFLESNKYCK
jgi:hypothetical protein